MMKKTLSLLILLSLLLAGCTQLPPEPTAAPTAAPVLAADTLTVHYLDVGQADCALIECGGEFMLIDGGNVDDGRLVVSYLESQGVTELKYVIATHPHEDHAGGLSAVLAVYPVENLWSPTRTHSAFFFDDLLYYAGQQDLPITIPVIGAEYTLGSAVFEAIGPLKVYPDLNDTSIVLSLTHGENTFLFTGDMERTAELDLLDSGTVPEVEVLKVSHHGSSDGTSYRFLYETEPEYAIISCETGNPYGHPHRELVARLQDAGIPAFRTDKLGTITATSDGAVITMTWENQNAAPAEVTEGDFTLVGNRNSQILHAMSCDSLPKEKNRVYFEDYQEAIQEGFTPCPGCLG